MSITWMDACRPAREPSDPPTEPPEAPAPQDGPCELCRRCHPVVDVDGERLTVTVAGYALPCVCVYDRDLPVLVDGLVDGRAQGCECFERRFGGE